MENSTKKTWRYTTRPLMLAGDIAYVPLTRDKVAIIDAADAEAVGVWNWCAMPAKGGKWYAYCSGIKKVRLQQFLMPSPLGFITDHKDRDGLNNRRSNLRFATPLQNTHNRARRRQGVTSFKGVSPHGSKWRARISVDGLRINLGYFEKPELAAAAYDNAAREYFCKFAVLNFPDKPSYDGQKDLAGSIKEGFAAIRERVAAGGPGWQRKGETKPRSKTRG